MTTTVEDTAPARSASVAAGVRVVSDLTAAHVGARIVVPGARCFGFAGILRTPPAAGQELAHFTVDHLASDGRWYPVAHIVHRDEPVEVISRG